MSDQNFEPTVTDGRTERGVLRAAWMQLKIWFNHQLHIITILDIPQVCVVVVVVGGGRGVFRCTITEVTNVPHFPDGLDTWDSLGALSQPITRPNCIDKIPRKLIKLTFAYQKHIMADKFALSRQA